MRYIDYLKKDYVNAVQQWRERYKELNDDEWAEANNLAMMYGGKKQWDRDADVYEQVILSEVEQKKKNTKVWSQLRRSSVLDAGCGYGYLLNRLYHLKLRRLFGLDISQICVDICGNRFSEQNIKAEIKQGNLIETGYECDQFGLIVCTEVLEHCRNPLAVINEMYRILKPGGFIYFSMPYCDKREAWTHINFFYIDFPERRHPDNLGKDLSIYNVYDIQSMMFESYFVEFEVYLTVRDKFIIVEGKK